MSKHLFGQSKVKPTRAQARVIRAIAAEHDAEWFEVSGQAFGGYHSWFSSRNMGEPFDSNRASAVYAALVAAGVDEGSRGKR